MATFDHLQRKRSLASAPARPAPSLLRPSRQFAPLTRTTSDQDIPVTQAQFGHATPLQFSIERIPISPPPRKNNTGLPDNLKAGIENLSGMEMDDVHVHYNSSKPAEVQSLAYTQGTDIQVGPGQEQHLAHEAWHVVQQKQGRVTPTIQAKGVAINDDEVLEREADVIGEQAARLPATMQRQVTWTGGAQRARRGFLTPSIPIQRHVIQRRVGFEFEAAKIGGWTIEAQLPEAQRKKNDDGWEGVSHTKASLILTPNMKGNISADNGSIEFRTEPLATLQEVTDTINQLLYLKTTYQAYRETLLEGQMKTNVLKIINDANHTFQNVRISGGQTLTTRPQATLGIKLSDIPSLLTKLVAIRGTESARAKTARRTRIGQHYAALGNAVALDLLVAGDITNNAENAVQLAGSIYQEALHLHGQPEPQGVRTEIVGLLTLILKSLFDAYHRSLPTKDMKEAFPLMPRTDLRSAFLSMEVAAQTFMVTLWGAGQGPLYTRLHAWDDMGHSVFPHGYTADNGVNQGPTQGAWLRSIVEPNQQQNGRDVLSPAPGYNRLEGFGSLGVDPLDAKLVLLEFRGIATLGQTATISSDQWLDVAQSFFKLVESVTNPPQPPANVVQNAPVPVAAHNAPPIVQNAPMGALPPVLPLFAHLMGNVPVQQGQQAPNPIGDSDQPDAKRHKAANL